MPKIADRVKETSTSTGTGTINLGGAATGYRAFSSAFVTTDVVYYCIDDGVNWEVGYGTLTTGTPWTLSRTLLASSTGSLIDFGVGAKSVFCTAPASDLDIQSATAKSTPVDADILGIIDSAASNLLKKLTWADLKATLKTYLDTLYITAGGALGTPSSGVATNLTGTAAGLTAGAVAVGGVTGLGTGVATFLATPSSANLAAALTDEEGSGKVPLATTGTWTPQICFGGRTNVTGITYSYQAGAYTRIGNLVFFDFYIVLTSKGSSSGLLLIEPPVAAANIQLVPCSITNLSVSGAPSGVETNVGGSPGIAGRYLGFQVTNLSTTTYLNDTHVSNNSEIIGSGVYRV